MGRAKLRQASKNENVQAWVGSLFSYGISMKRYMVKYWLLFLYSRINKAHFERGSIISGMKKWNFYFIIELLT